MKKERKKLSKKVKISIIVIVILLIIALITGVTIYIYEKEREKQKQQDRENMYTAEGAIIPDKYLAEDEEFVDASKKTELTKEMTFENYKFSNLKLVSGEDINRVHLEITNQGEKTQENEVTFSFYNKKDELLEEKALVIPEMEKDGQLSADILVTVDVKEIDHYTIK